MDTPFVEKAIPMVSVDQKTGKYVLTTQALNFFKAINGPIAVVSVAGLYRTGKSYLLNRVLLNRSNGFGVGPTVNPCTKGLWCWGTPIKGTSTDGEPVSIVVIDTEGIGALDQDQTHDTKIFTLAILASSCFIYNSVGSIDQTAIQNLSLVVNLTKHIQLKSSDDEGQEGVDPDEISMYFPTFYWVVRDFSLQLQDTEGNPMSSREYLERALAPQNGFSDDIEEKNRIRRLLTAFFKDRDCVTMIRPLVDEMKLQNLDKMDYDELRPQFVQQAMGFRKRIISSVKAKTLQNKKLNGVLYCSMINSYVTAINEGAVPNIENAWNYMCEEQCHRALEECYELFIRHIQSEMRELPKPQQFFERCVSEGEEKALDAFREKALGSQAVTVYAELKKRIRTQIGEIREQNIKDSSEAIRNYIKKTVTIIGKKLNNQQYTSYSEFEREVVQLSDKFTKEGPKYHNYQYIYLEAIRKLSAQGADFLFKKFSKQQQKAEIMNKEREKQLTGEIATLREQMDQTKREYFDSVSNSDQKIFELTSRCETLANQLVITKKAQEEQQTKIKREFDLKMSQMMNSMKERQIKMRQISDQLQSQTKQFTSQKSNWKNQEAIFQQQIKLQTLQIEELQKKQKSLDAALAVKQNSMSKQVRQISIRLESEKQQLKRKYQDQVQLINTLTQENTKIKQELEKKTMDFRKREQRWRDQTNSTKSQTENTRRKLEMEHKQVKQDLEMKQDVMQRDLANCKSSLMEAEIKVKQLNERLFHSKKQQEKNQLMSEQQLEFLRQENQGLRKKASQIEESHRIALDNFRESVKSSNQENASRIIVEMKNEHQLEIQRKEQQFQIERVRMQSQIDSNNANYANLDQNFSMYKKQQEARDNEQKTTIEQLRSRLADLSKNMNCSDREYKNMLADQKKHYEEQLEKLEQELRECKDKHMEQLEKMTEDTQTKLGQLRAQNDIESENYQKKLAAEKQKNEKKLNKLNEEHTLELEQERETLENELMDLQERYNRLEDEYRNTSQTLQHNLDIQTKQVATLTETNREQKQTMDRREREFNEKEVNLTTMSKLQKQKLEQKLEGYITELNQKERQSMNYKHQRDQFASLLQKRQKKISQIEPELARWEVKHRTEVERLTERNKELEKEMMQRSSNESRQYALLDQKLKFQIQKTTEMERNYTIYMKSSQQKIALQKSQKEEEIKNLTSRLTAQKQAIDSKYQNFKNLSKETQNGLKKALNDALTSNSLLEQKCGNLQSRLRDVEAGKANQIQLLKAQIMNYRQNFMIKEKELTQLTKSMAAKIEKLENDKQEMTYTHDKDKAVLMQKISFSEKKAAQSLKQADEKILKLSAQLANEQNSRLKDKDSQQSHLSQAVTVVQSKLKTKIEGLEAILATTKSQSESTIKAKDAEIKSLIQKLSQTQFISNNNSKNSAKAIEDLMQMKQKQSDEIQRLKRDLFEKQNTNMRKQARQKQDLKNRLQTQQRKLRAQQQKIMQMGLDHQRQRKKIQSQLQKYSDRFNQQKQLSEKYKKDYDKAKSEVDKFKAERKGRSTYISGLATKTYIEPKFEKSIPMVEDPNKQNSNFQ